MTPRNLFNVILKIFGLFFLREIIYIIPQLISSIPTFVKTNDFGGEQYNSGDTISFIVTLISISFYIFIIYQLLFNTNKIIHKLKLDQGFNQQEFSFNISTSLILTISLIVIGFIILTNEIPIFCRIVFSYFEDKNFTLGMPKPNYSYIVASGVKILIGLLIIGERKRIVEFVEKRQVTKEEENEVE